MAKTAAERQTAYRAKRPFAGEGENGQRRLSTWVNTGASLALARLAKHNGLSKREMLERLITVTDDANLAGMELDSPEWEAYFAE
jgi:hypothetical protein